MKKYLLEIFIGILVGLFAGYYITTKFLFDPIPSNYVRVTVDNNSGQKIKTLTLKYRNGRIEIKDLPDRESAKLIFKIYGEDSYQIVATFDNDSTVSSRGEYVESGSTRTEKIYKDRIESDRKQY